MQIITCPPYDAAIRLAAARLGSGGVIVYPTDTVYGIGCDALNASAIKKIMGIKGREGKKPLSVLFPSWEAAKKYVKIDDLLAGKLGAISPGPYTFLLPLKKPLPVTPDMVLGCRVPDSEFCKRIGGAFGNPIVSTSANVSGRRSPSSALEVDARVLKKADLVVDGGPAKYMQGSTVIDVGNGAILRRGAGLQKAQKWLESL